MSWLELRIPPLALLLVCVALFVVSSTLSPMLRAINFLSISIGASIALAGALICGAGVSAFIREQTTVNPMQPQQTVLLVTNGIYQRTRNPMYLGFSLMLAGTGVALGNFLSVALVPFYVTYLTQFQIVPEERVLLKKFGEGYLAYAKKVGRWI